MDATLTVLLQLSNELRKIMEVLNTTEVISGENKDSERLLLLNNEGLSSALDLVNIQDLERQMKIIKEEVCKNSKNTSMVAENSVTPNNLATIKNLPSTLPSLKHDAHDNRSLLDERNSLTRENKNLKEEAARLRDENISIKKKLEEEASSRIRLQRELSEFTKMLKTNKMQHDTEVECNKNNKTLNAQSVDRCQSDTNSNTDDRRSLSATHDTSGRRLSATQDNTVERFYYEKVAAYKSNSHDGYTNEREDLRCRNIELERQLSEAKKTVRSHEKRLLAYSQLQNNPMNVNSYKLKPQVYAKASSCPSSPCNNNITNSYDQSLFRKHYDSNVQGCDQYLNVMYESKSQRKSNSCDSISSDCTSITSSCSSQEGCDWRYYNSMDVIARRPGPSSSNGRVKLCEYKSN